MNFLKKEKFPKIGNIFVNQTIFDEYSARIYKIDPFSMSMTKKIQVDKNGSECILFRIDVYFNKYLLAVQIGENLKFQKVQNTNSSQK